jgi:hypothetical protein
MEHVGNITVDFVPCFEKRVGDLVTATTEIRILLEIIDYIGGIVWPAKGISAQNEKTAVAG